MRVFFIILGVFLLLGITLSAQNTEPVRKFVQHRLIGDAHLADGDLERALAAYRKAIGAEDKKDEENVFSQLKTLGDSMKLRSDRYKLERRLQNERLRAMDREQAEGRETLRQVIAEAEKKGREAQENFRQVVALRLATQADEQRIQGNYEDALLLAYEALELADKDNRPDIMRYFSLVVRDKYAVPLPIQQRVVDVQNTEAYILLREAELAALYRKGQSKPTTSVPAGGAKLLEGDYPLLTYDAQGGNIQLYDAKRNVHTTFNDQHAEAITGVTISGDSKITASRDNTAIVWQKNNQPAARLVGHEGNVYDVHYLNASACYVSRSSDGTVRRWDRDGTALGTLLRDAYVYDLLLSPDEKHLVATTASGNLLLWSTAAIERAPDTLRGNTTVITRLTFLPGKQARLVGIDRKGKLFGWALGQDLEDHFAELSAFRDFICLPKQQELVSWDAHGRIYHLSARGDIIKQWQAHDRSLVGVDYDPDTGTLLTTGTDRQVKWWKLTGEQLLDWALTKKTDGLPARFVSGAEDAVIIPYFYENRISVHRLPGGVLSELKRDPPVLTEAFLRKYDIEMEY